MSIDHWTSERGRQAAAGLPLRWRRAINGKPDASMKMALAWTGAEYAFYCCAEGEEDDRDAHWAGDVQVLGILRMKAMERLLEQGMFVYPSMHLPAKFGTIDMREHVEGNELVRRGPRGKFDDLDEALIEALLATAEEAP